MKTHEITTSKVEFVVVESNELLVTRNTPKLFDFQTNIHIVDGIKYECIFKLSQATEEDAKLIGDEPEYIPCYNCLNGCPICSGYGYSISWTNELISLLKSKGIDINNGNWYLFKKI